MTLLDAWVLFLFVGTAAVFLAGVWVIVRLARRHQDDDSRAMAKAGIAIVLSILLGLGGVYVLHSFQQKGIEGTHESFVAALNKTIGDGDYHEALRTVAAREQIINVTLPNNLAGFNATIAAHLAANPDDAPDIANGTTTGLPPHVAENVTKRDEALTALTKARDDKRKAEITVRKLTPNHTLWLKLEHMVREGRDAEAEILAHRALDAGTVDDPDVLPMDEATVANLQAPCKRDADGFCAQPLQAVPIEHGFFDAHENRNIPVSEGAPAAFDGQREFNHQMDTQMKLLGYSMVTGFMMAPFVFAGGAILRRAYVPSDTIGFKAYPSKSAGWFLLLGALGVFAIPFAAWTLRDLHKRSTEGQIAL